jgi:hypothetical protein
MAAISRKG